MAKIGILRHSFSSPRSLEKHYRLAKEAGFQEVYMFTPGDVHLGSGRISAFIRKPNGWKRRLCGLPDIVHDIGYYSKPSHISIVKKLKHGSTLPFCGYSLGHKWSIQQHLLRSEKLLPHLLPTKLLTSADIALQMLEEHGAVMLKPLNGMQGRGIWKLSRSSRPGYFNLQSSRDKVGKIASRTVLIGLIRRLQAKQRYLVQQWIDIRGKKGTVFDIRSLVQKNGEGSWGITGIAVRQGRADQITSNISGGGQAFQAASYLSARYGEASAEQLMATLTELSQHIPDFLEQSYGKRLAELGIDFAVDPNGHLWLFEVNIKPGRSIIHVLYGKEALKRSRLAPYRYAKYLLETNSAFLR